MRRLLVAFLVIVGTVAAPGSPAGTAGQEREKLILGTGLPTLDSLPGSRAWVDAAHGVLISTTTTATVITDLETRSSLELTVGNAWPGDRNTIVLCGSDQILRWDLQTESALPTVAFPDRSVAPVFPCEMRGTKVFTGFEQFIHELDLLSGAVVRHPHGRDTHLDVVPGRGREGGQLHLQSVAEYWVVDQTDPIPAGPVLPHPFDPDPLTGAEFASDGPDLVATYADGSTVRTFCPGCARHPVTGIDSSRVVAYTPAIDRWSIVELGVDEVASIPAGGPVELLGAADQGWAVRTRDGVVLVPPGWSAITSWPTVLPFDSERAGFEFWSRSEPSAVRVDGRSVPFQAVRASVSIARSAFVDSRSEVVIDFADGTSSAPVDVEIQVPPRRFVVQVTAFGDPGQSTASDISINCNGGEVNVARSMTPGSSFSIEVPEGSRCDLSGAGRFGPLLEDRVVDYASTMTVYPESDVALGVWLGADLAHPVKWIALRRSGSGATSRAVTLHCPAEGLAWTLDLEYGAVYRFVLDTMSSGAGGSCEWTGVASSEFDISLLDEYGPRAEFLERRPLDTFVGDASTLAILFDAYRHPESSTRAFVDATARRAFGRRATVPEHAGWDLLVNRGGDGKARVVAEMLVSDTYDQGTQRIARLYQAYFDRLPDPNGLEYWLYTSTTGYQIDDISRQFAASREFQLRYGGLDRRTFIDLVYRNVLGRPPEAKGYAYWLEQMRAGMTGPELMMYFSDSTEFRNIMRQRLRVAGAYAILADREPSTAEMTEAIRRLAESASPTEGLVALALDLLSSPEYRGAFDDHWTPTGQAPNRLRSTSMVLTVDRPQTLSPADYSLMPTRSLG